MDRGNLEPGMAIVDRVKNQGHLSETGTKFYRFRRTLDEDKGAKDE